MSALQILKQRWFLTKFSLAVCCDHRITAQRLPGVKPPPPSRSFLTRQLNGRKTRRPFQQRSYSATYFSDPGLNRILPSEEDELSTRMANAKFLLVKDGKCLVESAGENGKHVARYLNGISEAKALAFDAVAHDMNERLDVMWLGSMQGKNTDSVSYFAIDVSGSDFHPPTGTELLSPRDLASSNNLEDSDAGIMATAVGKGQWHRVSKFCSNCGSPTSSRNHGTSRKCTNSQCNKIVFPRVDPAVIALVTHGDYCLLGRQSRWVPGRHSCLAGFVELGETLEDGIIREVFEEAGVHVNRDSIKYIASQPWPFPQSLMLGFHADVIPGPDTKDLPEIRVDEEELESARWVKREDLAAIMESQKEGVIPTGLHVPGKYSLAWLLMADWVKQK